MAFLYPYIFGNNSNNFSYSTTLSSDQKFADKNTLGSDDTIYNLIFNGIKAYNSTVKLKGFIYSDNGGVPDTLIAVTDETIGIEVGSHVALPFSTPVFLTAGDYWLGVISDTYIYLWGSSYSTNSNYLSSDTYADGPSDPFGSYTGSSPRRIIYATGEAIPITDISVVNSYAVLSPPEALILSTNVNYAVLKDQELGNNNFLRNPNCVALYRFEDFEIGIDSKGINDLTESASPPTAFFGEHKEGNFAVDFDDTNNQYLYIDDANLSSNFPYKSGQSNFDFAICVWVKFNTVVAWGKDHIIFSKGKNAFSLHLSRGAIAQLRVSLDNDGYVVSETIVQDKWYHISVSYDVDSNFLQIRIWDFESDSLLSNTVPNVNISLVANSNPVQIGTASDDVDYADICLDELVIFNKSITTEDMDAIRQGIYTFASVNATAMIIT